jgi:hypothetical protein
LYFNYKSEISNAQLINFELKNHHMKANEFFSTTGEELLAKVKELIAEGNVRRITITDKTGKELVSFPLTIGVVGAVLAPVLAAIGALAALIGECTIAVEREDEVN